MNREEKGNFIWVGGFGRGRQSGGGGGRQSGGDARAEKGFLSAVPLFGKVESLMPLDLCASSRTDRGAIRPYSGLNTPLFLPFENGKKS